MQGTHLELLDLLHANSEYEISATLEGLPLSRNQRQALCRKLGDRADRFDKFGSMAALFSHKGRISAQCRASCSRRTTSVVTGSLT